MEKRGRLRREKETVHDWDKARLAIGEGEGQGSG